MGRLEAMQAFVAVVEGHGFSAASRSLGIPLPTVSRWIAELEQQLGTQLLMRSTRKVVVTDSGRQYYESVHRILESLADAEVQAAGEYRSPRGQLTITAPTLFGRLHVLPIVSDFMASHGEIKARLHFSDFVTDLVEEHVDLGVRIGNLTDVSLIAAKVGEVRNIYCASPDYFAARGLPRLPEELVKHDCIAFSKSGDPVSWVFRSPGQAQQVMSITPRLSVNTADAAAAAAIAGGGITWLYSYQAAPHLAAGSLSAVLAKFEADPVPVSIIYPAGRLVPQKVRHFIDFAAKRLHAALHEVNSVCNAALASRSDGARIG
jgi:DNA-binding transcriptional LysR family regulator